MLAEAMPAALPASGAESGSGGRASRIILDNAGPRLWPGLAGHEDEIALCLAGDLRNGRCLPRRFQPDVAGAHPRVKVEGGEIGKQKSERFKLKA